MEEQRSSLSLKRAKDLVSNTQYCLLKDPSVLDEWQTRTMAGASKKLSLAATGLETMKLFKKVKAIDQGAGDARNEEWPKALFAAEADRFELWAVNLGLFVSGHGSLDYRVREAESLGLALRRFMSDLNDSLAEGQAPPRLPCSYFADARLISNRVLCWKDRPVNDTDAGRFNG